MEGGCVAGEGAGIGTGEKSAIEACMMFHGLHSPSTAEW